MGGDVEKWGREMGKGGRKDENSHSLWDHCYGNDLFCSLLLWEDIGCPIIHKIDCVAPSLTASATFIL